MKVRIEDEVTGIIALTKELTLISNLESMMEFNEEPEATKSIEAALANSKKFVHILLESGVIPDIYLQRIDLAMNPETEFYLEKEEAIYHEDVAICDSLTAAVAITKMKDSIKVLEKSREFIESDEELEALDYSINHSKEYIEKILKLGYLNHDEIKIVMEAANPYSCLYIDRSEV